MNNQGPMQNKSKRINVQGVNCLMKNISASYNKEKLYTSQCSPPSPKTYVWLLASTLNEHVTSFALKWGFFSYWVFFSLSHADLPDATHVSKARLLSQILAKLRWRTTKSVPQCRTAGPDQECAFLHMCLVLDRPNMSESIGLINVFRI
jgi:hypothetical protein